MKANIPFNRTWHARNETEYLAQALASADASPIFTTRSMEWLQAHTGAYAVHLTHSCTAALEMAAILADIRPGDEVIMPSFTFPSTANAFVLRGGIPVFVDIRPDTLNLDETLIEAAITSQTKAIVPMHYAGVACEMDTIMAIADRHGLLVIEDAAQSIGATYKGKPLGTLGHLGAYSFHKTKNIQCMAGGALLINQECFEKRAETIAEKGTDIRLFQQGKIQNYTWKDIGSAFLMTELHAAVLLSQLEELDAIQGCRLQIWTSYFNALRPLEENGFLERPLVSHYAHNAHVFHIMLADREQRNELRKSMEKKGISLSTHYEPLHTSTAGKARGRASGSLSVTEAVSQRMLRLPLYPSLSDKDICTISECLSVTLHEIMQAYSCSVQQ